ncbi:MAG: hypothetical protein LWX11_09055 [Firmicutes bacterium]|nr:hypothetical protein [Bacillota bacterium]
MPLPLPVPDPLPLPLPPGLFKALLVVTGMLHLLAVNLAVGGALVLSVHALRGRSSDREWVARLVPLLPPAITFAITLGVAPLLFLQLLYGDFFYTASVLMAAPWLAFIALLMLGYALVYRFVKGASIRGRSGLMGMLLLLGVGFLWVSVTTLSLRPDLWAAQAAAAPHGGWIRVVDASLWPRFLHMVTGFAAVAGLLLALWGGWRGHGEARRAGLHWFAWATLSQLLWGGWLLMAQPRPLMKRLMHIETMEGFTLWISVAAGLAAAHFALKARKGEASLKGLWLPFALGLLSVLGMIWNRDQLRDMALEALGFRSCALPHATDGLSFVIFLITVAAVALLIGVMVRWIRSHANEVAP